MRTKVAKWGNSLAVRIPREVGERLALAPGMWAEIALDADGFRVTPASRRLRGILSLQDMVDEMRRRGAESEPDDADWGPDRGAEAIDDAYSRGEIALDDLLSDEKHASRRR